MQLRPSWTRFVRIGIVTVLPGLVAVAGASSAAAAPLPEGARAAIENLLQKQTSGLPGKVSFSTRGTGTLPPCDDFEAFLPNGTTPRGRISVGLRCRGDKPWTRFVPAQVAVEGRYYVAARAIDAGEPLGAADVVERSGDLGDLPRSVITEASALQGVVATNRIAAGAPLRKESMRGVVVIQQGQTVQLVAQGAGFSISTEGKAMTRAEVGATVQAKTRDGRLLTGVASEDGQIRLAQ